MEDVSNNNPTGSELKSWLKVALSAEDIQDFSVEFEGSTEKGDGYLGDVFFVTVTTDQKKVYDLVLKCSKRSVVLRETTPATKTAYLNEIYNYRTVFPAFRRFELERGIEKPFDSVAKYYGTFISENMEVLAIENLKAKGYLLHDRKKPLDPDHLFKVIREYGKYHAISVAFQDQKPDEFKKIPSGLKNCFEDFKKTTDFREFYTPAIKQVCAELEGELDPKILKKWETLIDQIDYIFGDMYLNNDNRLVVLNHGDCWNNNFMYYYDNNKTLSKVAILDWQVSWVTTPITDLSYFLFATISEEGLKQLDSILKAYYETFSERLEKLGSDPQKLYPFDQFIADWKKYCRFGLLMTNLILKICQADKGEVKSMEDVVESGQKIEEAFNYDIQNKDAFRKRIKPIVKYAIENDLL